METRLGGWAAARLALGALLAASTLFLAVTSQMRAGYWGEGDGSWGDGEKDPQFPGPGGCPNITTGDVNGNGDLINVALKLSVDIGVHTGDKGPHGTVKIDLKNVDTPATTDPLDDKTFVSDAITLFELCNDQGDLRVQVYATGKIKNEPGWEARLRIHDSDIIGDRVYLALRKNGVLQYSSDPVGGGGNFSHPESKIDQGNFKIRFP